MTKVNKLLRKSDSRRHRVDPYKLSSRASKVLENAPHKKCSKGIEKKKEWEDSTCSVCMEYPHNAVLLLCSSYNKGCRPYMCATSYRYSNCLEQYKKAYTKVSMDDLNFSSGLDCPNEKIEATELLCPLCRGQVKGWTVVESARDFFNRKRRTCTQDNCSFVGTYKQLRKHVRAEHPGGRPREVDPSLVEKWEKLEDERERNDVISTIRSSMPGAIFFGDYVIERRNYGDYDVDDYLDDALFRLESYGGGANNRVNSHRTYERGFHSWDDDDDVDDDDDDDDDFGIPSGSAAISGHVHHSYASRHHSRLLLGRSRRRRRRAANGGR